MSEVCLCGSQVEQSKCCDPFLTGQKWPATPEECMRARYSAYVTSNIDFIKATQSSSKREEVNWDDTQKWADNATWKGLEIVAAKDNQVEFIAHYDMDGKNVDHHELSTFIEEDGKWFFDDGGIVQGQIRRDGDKVGRNDPCPCGSGKKHKKCCLNK